MAHRRLLDEIEADPLEAQLLRDARREGPDPARRARILAAVAAAGVLGGQGVASAGEKAGSALTRLGRGRGMLMAGAALGVPVALWMSWTSGHVEREGADDTRAVSAPLSSAVPELHEPRAASNPQTGSERAETDARDRRGTQPEAKPAPASATEQSLEPERREPRRESVKAMTPVPADSLKDEVMAIRKAREHLARGDATGALLALNGYGRRFPNGHLRQEATLVRVEALLSDDQAAEARRVGRAFMKRHPDSPYGERLAALLSAARVEGGE
jgi:TolA-binding protein